MTHPSAAAEQAPAEPGAAAAGFPLDTRSPIDHAAWRRRFDRQMRLLRGRACDPFLDGVARLGLEAERTPDLELVDRRVMDATGWRLLPVAAPLPPEPMFGHLAERRLPVVSSLRSAATRSDALHGPGLFHDVFGLAPMLLERHFALFLQRCGTWGLEAGGEEARRRVAQLYHYTVRTGLVATPDGCRVYGAATLTSEAAAERALGCAGSSRIGFELARLLRTRIPDDPDDQQHWFVIDGFRWLADETAAGLRPYLSLLRFMPELAADGRLPADRIWPPDARRSVA